MPILEWIGKYKAINHHHVDSYWESERQYSFDEDRQHDADNISVNMISSARCDERKEIKQCNL